jgi:hypothetical protein
MVASVLVVVEREDELDTTVARYLTRVSFVMAALPAAAASAANIIVFDAVVAPATVKLVLPERCARFEIDDPIVVSREVRAHAKRGISRHSANAQSP